MTTWGRRKKDNQAYPKNNKAATDPRMRKGKKFFKTTHNNAKKDRGSSRITEDEANMYLHMYWDKLPLDERLKYLKELGYEFDQSEIDFHGAGIDFVDELTVGETIKLAKSVRQNHERESLRNAAASLWMARTPNGKIYLLREIEEIKDEKYPESLYDKAFYTKYLSDMPPEIQADVQTYVDANRLIRESKQKDA